MTQLLYHENQRLMREVSDCLHLRRFCLLALHQHAPDESTVRKLTPRLGSPLVTDLIRALIATALRERHFHPRALRCVPGRSRPVARRGQVWTRVREDEAVELDCRP